MADDHERLVVVIIDDMQVARISRAREWGSVDFRRQLAKVRAWLPFLVGAVLLASAAAFVISNLLPKVYEAKATLIVGQSLSSANPDYNQLLASQRLSTTYAIVATTRPLLEATIDQLGLTGTADELERQVRADAPRDSTLVSIIAQDSDPARAARIANALADQLIAASPAIQGRESEVQKSIDADLKATQDDIAATQAQVEALAANADRTAAEDARLEAVQGRLVTLRATYAALLSFASGNATNQLSVIEPAVAPTSPVSPRPLLNVILAALLGLMVAATIAFVFEYLDDGVKSAEDVESAAGLPTLGTIMQIKGDKGRNEIYRLAALLYPRSGAAEAYRALRTNLEFASVDAPIRTLLVTSSAPGEGKTVTAANLAVVFAQAGRRVFLVDADLRKPGVHQMFDLPNEHGLTTLFRGDAVALDAVSHEGEQSNLRILTSGPLPPNPAEVLGSQRMRAVLERVMEGADLVIIDSPPLQAVTDSAVLSSYVDGTLFVIDARRSRRGTVRKAREALALAGANVLGAVLNRVPARSRSDYGEYYGADPATGATQAGRGKPVLP